MDVKNNIKNSPENNKRHNSPENKRHNSPENKRHNSHENKRHNSPENNKRHNSPENNKRNNNPENNKRNNSPENKRNNNPENKKTSSENKSINYDDALVNHICYCNNYFYNKTKIVVLLPCNHLMHEKCISYFLINNKKKCPLCDVPFIKIVTENRLSNPKYHQNIIDIKSVRLSENTSFINYYTLPFAVVKFTSIMNRLIAAQTHEDVFSVGEYFFRLFNIKINLIDNTENNPIYYKNNIVKWKKKEDDNSNIIILSNHTNYIDTMILLYLFKAGCVTSDFVNKFEIGRRVVDKCNLLVFKRGKDTNMVEKIKEYLNIHKRIIMYPEGGMGNHETLFRFRTGAFYTGGVICPIIIKYRPYVWDDNFKKYIFKLTTQEEINVDVYVNDLQYPPFNNEKIEKVRDLMVEVGDLKKSRVSNKFVKE
jgi:1-acyl-sn-glycerol-3-phosphate acyltransferase